MELILLSVLVVWAAFNPDELAGALRVIFSTEFWAAVR